MLCLPAPDRGTQLWLPVPLTLHARRPRPAQRHQRRGQANQLPIVWAPQIDRNALVLRYEPLARKWAANAFDRCKGRAAGLEGKAQGGLLPALQAEALYALWEAAQRFDPTRLAPSTGQPVKFGGLAKQTVKWAIHHFLKGGRKPVPWSEGLTDRALEQAEEVADMDAAEAQEIRERIGALPDELIAAARVLEAGGEVEEETIAALRYELGDLAPDLSAATVPATQRIRPARPAEEIERGPLVHAQAPRERRGGVSLW